MRLRAIACALFYGIAPWQLYEDEPHYRPWGYWRHLGENLAYAWSWMTFRETEQDHRFERAVNGRRRLGV
jgi:hypothetical protein